MPDLDPEENSKYSVSPPPNWRTMSCSVMGARHAHNQSPCQDAALVQKFDDMVLLAVADGHGDSKHSLSERGSQFAVETACQILRQALRSIDNEKSAQEVLEILSSSIAGRIAWEWNIRCKKDALASSDVTVDGEWSDTLISYGSTLIAIGISEKWLVAYQLGDGDILLMDTQNQPHFLFPEEEISGVFTHSLCQPNHLEKAQLYCQKHHDRISKILICTDGIRDSLSGLRENLIQFANWLEQKIRREGWQETQEAMHAWLSELSLRGNGDDNSFALFWNEKG